MRSTTRFEKPHSLSYHETILWKLSVSEMPAVASTIDEFLLCTKSVDTTASSVKPRLPAIGPVDAALSAAMISSYDAPLLSVHVRSTTETSGVGTRNAMPVSLPLSSGSTLPTALAAPVEDGMMLAPAPVLLRRSVDRLLGRRGGVHRGHEALLDAEVVVDHLGERGEAVGRARRVGDDVHRLGVVLLLVDAHDEHGRVRGRRGDDHLLGPALDVLRRGVHLGEDARRLDDEVDVVRAPRDVARLAALVHRHLLAVDEEALLRAFDVHGHLAVHGVVLEHVRHVAGIDEGVVHRHHLHVLALERRAHHQPPDPPEAVDADADLLARRRQALHRNRARHGGTARLGRAKAAGMRSAGRRHRLRTGSHHDLRV